MMSTLLHAGYRILTMAVACKYLLDGTGALESNVDGCSPITEHSTWFLLS